MRVFPIRMLLAMLFCVNLAFSATPYAAADRSPENLQQILLAYDEEFLSSFRIHLKASIPYGDPQPGHFIGDLELTGKTGERFLKLTPAEFGKFIYYHSEDPLSHDDTGNLFVSRDVGQYIALDVNKGIVRYDNEKVAVNSEGQVVSSVRQTPRIEKYAANANDPGNLFFRYILPLGRGYSQLITHVDSVSTGPGGLMSVRGRGFLFSPDAGRWELEIDTERQYLVRKAVFTQDGGIEPVFVSESEGYYDSDVALGQKGTFGLRHYSISVSLIDYARAFDEALRTEVLGKVGLTPPEAWIMDFNLVDSDGVPLVIESAPVPKEASLEHLVEPIEVELESPIEKGKHETINGATDEKKGRVSESDTESLEGQLDRKRSPYVPMLGLGVGILVVVVAVVWLRRRIADRPKA